MANIVRKPNGTYLIRISAGKDDRGKSVTVSRTFTPSKPTLSYLSLQKEMNLFIENLQVQILNGEILDASGRKIAPNSSSKTLFRDFCEKTQKTGFSAASGSKKPALNQARAENAAVPCFRVLYHPARTWVADDTAKKAPNFR